MSDFAKASAFVEKLARPPPPGAPHGVSIEGSERENRTPVYRHWAVRNEPLLSHIEPSVRTLHDLFEFSAREYPDKPCLGARHWLHESKLWEPKFRWLSYADVAQRRHNFGVGLVEINRRLGQFSEVFGVGIWSQNRPEWQVVDLGCMSQGLYTVSLYETLGPDATEYIVKHAELSSIVCSLSHVPTLLHLAPRIPSLKLIISIDSLEQNEPEKLSKKSLLGELARQQGITLWSLSEVEQLGARLGRSMRPVQSSSLYTINYTSGTTGIPKGVLVSHASVLAANCALRIANPLTNTDVILSYLPLAHLMQRILEHAAFAAGASCGYFQGDLNYLTQDVKILQPTTFTSVPRLLNRFCAAIKESTIEADGITRALSNHALGAKLASIRKPIGEATCRHWLYDMIWTPKIRSALGFSRIRSMASGSAPLSHEVQEFLSVALGVQLFQGYGMTETCGIASVQLDGDFSNGNVGPPSPCVEVCLESIPELYYTVHDEPFPRGELLVRGPSIFSGYFKNEQETRKVVEADGWFHTGDVASIDSLGRISIIDRKKSILKLAQGEYVAPERLENIYTTNSPLITMAFVHGDSTKANLVGIFGVCPETFIPFACNVLQIPIADPSDLGAITKLVDDARVKQAFLAVLDKIGRDNKFSGYERVKNFMLKLEPFSIDNDVLTPTLKLKRLQAAKVYRKEIERMYAEIESVSKENSLKL